MSKKTISLILSDEILKRLEDYHYDKRMNRTEAIKQAVEALLVKEGY